MNCQGPTAKRRAKKARARQTVYERACKLVDKRDGTVCRVCEGYCEIGEHHHIKPRSLGGRHTTDNLIRIHSHCHQAITDKKLRVTGNADTDWPLNIEGARNASL